MSSHKHRTTTNSGKSGKSTTRATSDRSASSKPTAPASFETVFGHADSRELQELKAMRARHQAAYDRLAAEKEPALALLRVRRGQRLSRLRSHLRNLDEAILATTVTNSTSKLP